MSVCGSRLTRRCLEVAYARQTCPALAGTLTHVQDLSSRTDQQEVTMLMSKHLSQVLCCTQHPAEP